MGISNNDGLLTMNTLYPNYTPVNSTDSHFRLAASDIVTVTQLVCVILIFKVPLTFLTVCAAASLGSMRGD